MLPCQDGGGLIYGVSGSHVCCWTFHKDEIHPPAMVEEFCDIFFIPEEWHWGPMLVGTSSGFSLSVQEQLVSNVSSVLHLF